MNKEFPRRYQYGPPRLSCRWCGKEIDQYALWFQGPYCSLACLSAWGYYINICAALLMSILDWYAFEPLLGLWSNPFSTPLQLVFIILALYMPTLVFWILAIYGWRVRKHDPALGISRTHYDPSIRA